MKESNLTIKLENLIDYNHLGINVKIEYAEKIKRLIKSKFGSFAIAAKLLKMHPDRISMLGRRCTYLHSWKKILDLLELSLEDLEPNVTTVWDRYFYNIKFPLKLTPLYFRLVAHLIGDGCYKGNSAVWIQKDVEPIIKLQRMLLGSRESKWSYKTADHALIMDFYVKLVCAFLKIERKQIATHKFIESCKNLPRCYKIQVIAAIIEDESRIQPKSCSFRISMKNKEIITSLVELIDDLGYERSEIKRVKNRGFDYISKSYLFEFFIHIRGAHKFHNDIQDFDGRYGKIACLWKKQKQLEELVKYNNGRNAVYREYNEIFSKSIIDLIHKNGPIAYNNIISQFNVSYRKASSIVYKMVHKNKLKRINTGNYPALFFTK